MIKGVAPLAVLATFWIHCACADQADNHPTVRSVLRGCALAGVPRQKTGNVTNEDMSRLLDAMECIGVFTAITELDPMLPANLRSCIPPSVNLGQQIRAFLAEATRPDDVALDGDAAIVIAAVLKHTWPCSQP
jgi:hypothetical protein